MVTIGMKGIPGTTKTLQTLDQPGVLITEENLLGSNMGFLININDLSSAVLGSSPGTVEFSAGSEIRISLEWPRIYAMC